MQGTLVVLMALSGLGCHHKNCDTPVVASCYSTGYYGSCYSSGGCYSSSCYGSTGYSMPVAYVASEQSYTSPQSVSYGSPQGGCYTSACYSSCYSSACYSSCYSSSC